MSTPYTIQEYSSDNETEDQNAYQQGGYHPVKVGDRYNNYVVQKKLGWGYFSTVWLAANNNLPDDHPHKLVALKIQKSSSHYFNAALDEIDLLNCISLKSQQYSIQDHGHNKKNDDNNDNDNNNQYKNSNDVVISSVLSYNDDMNDINKEQGGQQYQKQQQTQLPESDDTANATTTAVVPSAPSTPTAISSSTTPTSPTSPTNDAVGASYVVQLLDSFQFIGPNGQHACLVFETMGKNVLKLIRHYGTKAIPPYIVKITSRQLLLGLHFLHTECNIIHTDLKPENLLLLPTIPFTMKSLLDPSYIPISPYELSNNDNDPVKASIRRFTLKISDLGTGCWVDKHFTEDISTRQYRAPESIVGLPYSTPVDIWATACIIFEMLTTDFLFDPKTDPEGIHSRSEDHLAQINELLGDFPQRFITDGRFSRIYFNKQGSFLHISDLESWPLVACLSDKYGMSPNEAKILTETLLLPMLRIEPNERITAQEALKSPWLDLSPHDITMMYLDYHVGQHIPPFIALAAIEYELIRTQEVTSFIQITRYSESRLERYLQKYCPYQIWLRDTYHISLHEAYTLFVYQTEQYKSTGIMPPTRININNNTPQYLYTIEQYKYYFNDNDRLYAEQVSEALHEHHQSTTLNNNGSTGLGRTSTDIATTSTAIDTTTTTTATIVDNQPTETVSVVASTPVAVENHDNDKNDNTTIMSDDTLVPEHDNNIKINDDEVAAVPVEGKPTVEEKPTMDDIVTTAAAATDIDQDTNAIAENGVDDGCEEQLIHIPNDDHNQFQSQDAQDAQDDTTTIDNINETSLPISIDQEDTTIQQPMSDIYDTHRKDSNIIQIQEGNTPVLNNLSDIAVVLPNIITTPSLEQTFTAPISPKTPTTNKSLVQQRASLFSAFSSPSTTTTTGVMGTSNTPHILHKKHNSMGTMQPNTPQQPIDIHSRVDTKSLGPNVVSRLTALYEQKALEGQQQTQQNNTTF